MSSLNIGDYCSFLFWRPPDKL